MDELQILVCAFSDYFRKNSVYKELFNPQNSWYQYQLPISSIKMPVAINEHINPLLEKSQRNVREFRKLIDEKLAKEPTNEKYGEFGGTKVCYEAVIAVFQPKQETGDDTPQVYIEDGSHLQTLPLLKQTVNISKNNTNKSSRKLKWKAILTDSTGLWLISRQQSG